MHYNFDHFQNFHFQGQKSGEVILMVIRRHWFNIAQQLFFLFFLIALLFVGLTALPIILPALSSPGFAPLINFFGNVLFIGIWLGFFIIWIDYYFDTWIITNERIVAIYQNGLFSREVSELRFERIQDVSTDVVGILPTLLNYGDLLIQTAGEEEKFVFKSVPDPYSIKSLVMNIQKEKRREDTNELGEMIEEKINGGETA